MKQYETRKSSDKHLPQAINIAEESSEDESLESNEPVGFQSLQTPSLPSYHLPPPPPYHLPPPPPYHHLPVSQDSIAPLNISNNSVNAIELNTENPHISSEREYLSNSIPKIAHYAWEGGEIPQLNLYNIFNFKRLNPDYDVIFWTSRPMTFFKAFDKALDSKTPAYRYMAFNHGQTISVRNPVDIYAQIDPKTRAFYEREKSGAYSNFAAASDLTRIAVMDTIGGLYMDSDVSTAHPIQRIEGDKEFFMYRSSRGYCNSVIASAPKTNSTQRMLDSLKINYMNNSMMWDLKRSEASFRHPLTLKTSGPEMVFRNAEPKCEDLIDSEFGQRRGDLGTLQAAMGNWKMADGTAVRYEFSAEQLLNLGHSSGVNADSPWAWRFRPGRRSSVS